jgi:hypothetical protein
LLPLLASTHLQIGFDGLHRAEPEMWVLAVAESPSPALGRVVGRLPSWVVEEYAQPLEVVEVQVLLLPAKWR